MICIHSEDRFSILSDNFIQFQKFLLRFYTVSCLFIVGGQNRLCKRKVSFKYGTFRNL
jgi:hypothetical protein